MEGPYFTEKHKGAQNPGYFRDPSIKEFQEWQQLADGTIVKIALAPEREGAFEFIREVSADGVLASIAHTDADYACCHEAVDAGARNYVHLFNGMKGIHHREPGVAGAALSDERVFAELICDGHHVHPTMARFAYRVKRDNLVMITDCMRAGLMPDGNYHLGEFPVVVDGGIALTESGSLAGSTLRLIDGVYNLQKWTDDPLYRIWHRASLSPAASLGKDKELGSIAPGKVADYVVVNQQLEIQAVVVAGKEKFRK
ncbi:amidohydrolase family protein [Virgibacillus halophilus]|uniref:Amidohydrolase family protein n=1 Tax=Tigheibacillus halophilus TaxID=361280 RepID=A0ABU5C3F5_9BACI|nr:amidohydrolase family protein [Virgibacillus halophilus]